MKKKKRPADLTGRNERAILKRIQYLAQAIVLLQGDRNKLQRQVAKLTKRFGVW